MPFAVFVLIEAGLEKLALYKEIRQFVYAQNVPNTKKNSTDGYLKK